MLLMPAVGGIAFLIIGLLCTFFPSRYGNRWWGYRSPKAMENERQWVFAQKLLGRKLLVNGALIMGVSLLGLLLGSDMFDGTLLTIILIVFIQTRIFKSIERELNSRFPSHFDGQ